MRDETELEEQVALAMDQIAEGGSKWPGMSYEQGVQNALTWAMEEHDEKPMEE